MPISSLSNCEEHQTRPTPQICNPTHQSLHQNPGRRRDLLLAIHKPTFREDLWVCFKASNRDGRIGFFIAQLHKPFFEVQNHAGELLIEFWLL